MRTTMQESNSVQSILKLVAQACGTISKMTVLFLLLDLKHLLMNELFLNPTWFLIIQLLFISHHLSSRLTKYILHLWLPEDSLH